VALEAACQVSPLFLVTEWVNESTFRQSPLVGEDPETKKQIMVIPDAGFTLVSQATGRQAEFYLELDLSTVSLKALRHRIRGYLLRHLQSPVLFVVPDAKRQNAIASVAGVEAKRLKANPTTIWITQKAQITPETVLATPWIVVGHQTPVTLQGLAEPMTEESAVVFAGKGGYLG
jgi:hypothetical protein